MSGLNLETIVGAVVRVIENEFDLTNDKMAETVRSLHSIAMDESAKNNERIRAAKQIFEFHRDIHKIQNEALLTLHALNGGHKAGPGLPEPDEPLKLSDLVQI